MATILQNDTTQLSIEPESLSFKKLFISVWPAAILFYSFFIPPEIAVYAGPLRLGGYRIFLIALAPVILHAILHRRLVLNYIDFLIIIVACWLPVSFAMNYNWAIGFEAGGSQTLDMVLAYFLGRTTIRSFHHLRALLICLLPGLLISGALLMLESVSGNLFVRRTLQSIFGGAGAVGNELRVEFRQGLLRAYSVYTHPIHAGIFLSSFVSLYYLLFRRMHLKLSGGLAALLGLFALSSAGILAFAMQLALIGFEKIQARIRDIGWKSAIAAGGIFVAAIHFFSQNGIIPVIYRYLTLNPATGYFRTQIWEYASAEALRHPWFGIGYAEYYRPEWINTISIDAHYLWMATRFGLVPSLLLFSAVILIIVLLARNASRSLTTASRDGFLALAISIFVVLILLFTVTFWGGMLAWWNFSLGMCVALTSRSQNLRFQSGVSIN